MPTPTASPWLPDASNTTPGKVSLAAQTFLGTKTFQGSIAITPLATPTAGTATTAATGGTLLSGTHYFYRVAAINAYGTTLACAEIDILTPGTVGVSPDTCTASPVWAAVPGATGYKVYGRSTGAELLMATIGLVLTWADTGSVTPSGALPSRNATSDVTFPANVAATGTVVGNGLYTGDGAVAVNGGGIAMALTSDALDGASAVGFTLNNSRTLSTSGAKLLSILNNTVEKVSVDKDGSITSAGIYVPTSYFWVSGGVAYLNNVTTYSGGLGLTFIGQPTDNASAIAHKFNTGVLATAGSKLLSIQNNTVEETYIDKDGALGIGYGAPLKIYPQEITPTACVAGAPSTGGSITDGTHSYKITFVTPDGESIPSAKSNVITAGTGDNTVGLTAIPIGSARCTQRKIYRTDAGDTGNWKLIATLNNNTATTYSDTSADGVGAAAPSVNTTSNVQLSSVADVSGVVAHIFDTSAAWSSGNLFSIKNNGVQKGSLSSSGVLAITTGGWTTSVVGANGASTPNFLTDATTFIDCGTACHTKVRGNIRDADGAVPCVIIDNGYTCTVNAKLLSIQNNTAEKAFIDCFGNLSLSGGLLGQKDILHTLTPTDTSTVTIDYSLGNAWIIDAHLLTNAHTFTIALSNMPTASYMAGYTVIIKTNTTIPTIVVPAGWTLPALSASSENWLQAVSIDGSTTTRLFLTASFT